MNKKNIITILLALVAMAGQGQIKCHVEGTLETDAWGDEVIICEAATCSVSSRRGLSIRSTRQVVAFCLLIPTIKSAILLSTNATASITFSVLRNKNVSFEA